MTLEYDESKNFKNIRKHHISIPELATIFANLIRSANCGCARYSVQHEREMISRIWMDNFWLVYENLVLLTRS